MHTIETTMFDPSGISAALGSIKVILELARNANDAQLAIRISSEIATVQGKLIDVQQQALALQNDNQELREKVRQLTQTLQEEKSFVYEHGVYWRTHTVACPEKRDENGNPTQALRWDGPFCPLCKDTNNKSVRLRTTGQTLHSQPIWECEVHHTEYAAPNLSDQGC